MKIAMIGQKGLPAIYGGVEQHVHELATGLVRRGFEVTVYARAWYTGGKNAPVNGVAIQHVPTFRTKHFDAIVHTFLATLHAIRQGFDVIHYHGVGPAILSFIPRLLSPKTRVIVTFHSIDRYHKKWGFLARLILKLGEWCACRFPHETITVSRGLRQYCLNEYQAETTYIPNGVDADAMNPAWSLVSQFGVEPQKYIVMISRLVPHKGAHLLLEAFTTLKKTDPNLKDLKLVVVGGSVYTDDYVAELHRLAAANNDIIFTGFISGAGLEALYRHARLLVHPSLNEGLPITVLKAMAHKTPVLLSNIPEHLELTKDPRCFFQENDAAALAEKLSAFLRLPESERREIAERNHFLVSMEYDWDVLLPQIEHAYHDTVPITEALSAH